MIETKTYTILPIVSGEITVMNSVGKMIDVFPDMQTLYRKYKERGINIEMRQAQDGTLIFEADMKEL